jgi:hypothetical protein
MFASLEDVSHTVFPRAKTVNSKNPLRFLAQRALRDTFVLRDYEQSGLPCGSGSVQLFVVPSCVIVIFAVAEPL